MTQDEPQFLTVSQAASLLGVHPNTIRRWAQHNQLPGHRQGKRGDWRFTREALLHMTRSVQDNGKPVPARFIPHKSLSLPETSGDFLAGGGEMGERIRSFDWSATPLGPVERWPQSLKTIVRIMLTSRQPIWIGWGPDLIKLYNDPYKAIVGDKHPHALGQPAAVVWHEIWDAIEPRLETAMQKNEGTYDESLLLIMERYGYQEETYYTFSYSPVPTEQGGVGGIICANTDDTERIIGERQLKLLRTLAAETTDARTIENACQRSIKSLAQNPHDLPFAMLYLLDQRQQAVSLAGTAGIKQGHPAVPQTARLDAASFWPFAKTIHTQEIQLISNLDQIIENMPAGAWNRAPYQAVALPIAPSGQTGQAGVLIVGLNPYRRFDEGYQGFLKLVTGQIAASIANAQAYEEERKRAEALTELDRAKTVFFSNVSHEFRTPLTLMLGPLEDIAQDPHTTPVNRDRITIAQRNAMRLLKLVNTLLDFSRLEAGRIQASYEPTDLGRYTAELASNFRPAIEQAGMELRLTIAPLSEPIYVDRDMWEKVVFNLLSNAFKFTFAGVIEIALSEQQEQVVFHVSDTGVGISERDLPRIFERFQRVEGGQARSFEGSGIGLALVQELVRLHKGTIEVESALGKGSTFTITLPKGSAHLPREHTGAKRTLQSTALDATVYMQEALQWLPTGDQTDDASADAFSSAEAFSEETPPADQPRIVLADDNADMRTYVQRLLRERFTVDAVPNGRRALEAVRSRRTDLVLSDVMMPEMDGFELLRALRCDTATSHIPVILLSARAGEEAQLEGIVAGADDYLVKPFSARELLARVEARLEIARLREEAEARVKAERQRLYNLFMQAPAIIGVFHGPSHIFELANPLALQALGTYRPIIGLPVREAIPEVEGQGLFELLDRVYQTGQPFLGNEAPVHLDRRGEGVLEELFFNFVYQPSYNAQGSVDGVLAYGIDVTEQVRAQRRSEELARQKDEFIGVTSHELKTPVTSLKAYTQLLERLFRQAGDDRAAALLSRMDHQVNKLALLIADLLETTRIESGKLQLHSSTFDLTDLIGEIVEDIQRTTGTHTIIVDPTPPITLTADRDRIGQVLTNLLTNAIKYSPQADTVIVKTVQQDGAVITSVQDFGIGIPAEQQAHLFERFYRVEGEQQFTYPGLGLGLYIAADFVQRHKGSIWVESSEGKGTTFFFSLPPSPPIDAEAP